LIKKRTNNKIKNILISGAGGFVGSNLVNFFNKKKIYVYYLSQKKIKNSYNSQWIKKRLISNFDNIKKKIDLVIHCAATGVHKKISKKKIFKTNFYQSMNFVKKFYNLNCNKFIILGTASEYGLFQKYGVSAKKSKLRPVDNYGRSKKKFFIALKKFSKNKKNLQILYLRLFHVYGENEPGKRLYPSIISACKSKKNFRLLNGEQIRDFLHVNQVSARIFHSLKKFKKKSNFFEVKNLATGKKTSIKEFSIKQWNINKCQGSLFFDTQTEKKTRYRMFSDTKSLL